MNLDIYVAGFKKNAKSQRFLRIKVGSCLCPGKTDSFVILICTSAVTRQLLSSNTNIKSSRITLEKLITLLVVS